MGIHRIEMSNGGVAYCSDKMAEDIDREVLKQLRETYSKSNKISKSIYTFTCSEQFSDSFNKALGDTLKGKK